MVNTKIFSTDVRNRTSKTNIVNKAGGRAYDTSAEHKLCQYVVTGTFNGIYYASAQDQLDAIKNVISHVRPNVIAKAAIYGHRVGKMKDMPAFLLAELAARKEITLLCEAWPYVITNFKMLSNFMQIVRSGVTGRKSFGTAIKKLIQKWIVDIHPSKLWKSSIGHSNPSLADVIRMVHPKPTNKWNDAFFAYILGKPYEKKHLTTLIKVFEAFKKNPCGELPNVPFQVLSNFNLSDQQWKNMATTMPWNTLRMNLNQLARHNVFDNDLITDIVASKLKDPEKVVKFNAFPYQLMNTYFHLSQDIPTPIYVALSRALDLSALNTPDFSDIGVNVCVDISGSMNSPITGRRDGATTTVTCKDVAALIASCIVKKNSNTSVIGWDHLAVDLTHDINPDDSILTIAKQFRLPGGATDASVALKHLNECNSMNKLVFYISDNQSWYGDRPQYCREFSNEGTVMAQEWQMYKRRVKGAKLVCLDIQPYGTVQVLDNKDVLNCGGWSGDAIFDIVEKFVLYGDVDFVSHVNGMHRYFVEINLAKKGEKCYDTL